ncbi:hypothetical protein Pmani_020453 [Petrolisthes manimaculis]|uniref:Uncharacterized protein n=1 Tax=Petrolisthes manimaculis TaxID=1843537 RepID=A0AAE1U6D2_9EUCA|nr:hypothetical protein Pmani_020453 [Petrolisthes manimaculis]
MDRLTLTQAGSSYRHTHSHSSWQLLWTDSLSLKLAALIDTLTLTQAGSSYGQTQGKKEGYRCEEREREKEGEKKGRREEKKDRDRERREEIKV